MRDRLGLGVALTAAWLVTAAAVAACDAAGEIGRRDGAAADGATGGDAAAGTGDAAADGALPGDGATATDGAAIDGAAADGAMGDAVVETTSATFSPSSADFPNPERGFYAFGETLPDLDAGTLGWIRDTLGLRLVFAPTTFSAYRDAALPQGYLDSLTAAFARVRAAGLKLVLRFAYNYDSSGLDAPLAIVQQHLGQLAPLLAANADVIAFLQAGFIGAWGEWHTSSNNLTTDASKLAVRDAVLAAMPATHAVDFRYPPDFLKWYPTPLGAAGAFSGTAQARTGHHNDCFMSSVTDVGTYSSDATLREQQRAYVKAMTAYVPFGGETCEAGSVSEQRRACSDILAEGRDFHLAYLNVSYYTGFHDQWRSEGCYDEVSRTMGYRFQLDAVSHPRRAARGGAITVTVALRNRGWARVFSARRVVVTLRHRSSGTTLAGTGALDLRTLPPQASVSTEDTVTVALPGDATTGDWDVAVSVPDVHVTTASDVRYSIRFANADDAGQDQAWDATAGRFIVGTTLTIE